MFSLLASYNQSRLQSKLYKAQAATLRANAKGTRNRANAQAATIQKAAQDNQLLAADNLTKAQANKRHAEGSLRTATAYSGFDTGKDSGSQSLKNLQLQLDAEIANMEQAASIAMLNSWQQALDTRRQGELEAYAQEQQANQQAMAAKHTRQLANFSLVAGALNAAYGAYSGYQSASAHNALQKSQLDAADAQAFKSFQDGDIDFNQYELALANNAWQYGSNLINPRMAAFSAASAAGYSGFHFANSFNPYTGALSADANNRKNNWGGLLSILDGNVPYKIPAAGTIFAQY